VPAAILQPPGECGASHDGGEAERVAGHDVDTGQDPLSLLHESEAFEGVAGECGIRAAEADNDQHAPARIEEYALGREDEKESDEKATGDIDQKRAVWERRGEIARDQEAQEVTGAGSGDGAERDPDIVDPEIVHDGAPPAKVM
jgi:hypothetical protein